MSPPRDKQERDERLDLVLRTIEENPQHWDQRNWHCGTSHCFAGFAQLLGRRMSLGTSIDKDHPYVMDGAVYHHPSGDAQEWLGLTEQQCSIFDNGLFDPDNDIYDLRAAVDQIKQSPYTPPL